MGDLLLLLLDQINTSLSMYLLWMTSGFTQITGVTLCPELSKLSIILSLDLAVLFILHCKVETSIFLFFALFITSGKRCTIVHSATAWLHCHLQNGI